MNRARWSQYSLMVARAAFALFIVLGCLTVSWEHGIFAAWPWAEVAVAGHTLPLGAALALPPMIFGAAAAHWALAEPRPRWRWGRWTTTAPVIGFGALTLIRAWPIHDRATWLVTMVSVGLFWAVYGFTVNVVPRRWIVRIMAVVLFVQGTVGIVQFVGQRSVGLTFAGELPLDPTVRGVSVIEAGGRRWLRAYGLTPHPNVLGGYLALCGLVCLGALAAGGPTAAHPRRGWLWPGLIVGSAALFVSFSRSAWLGTGAALLYAALVWRPWRQVDWRAPRTRRGVLIGAMAILALLLIVGLAFGDLLLARFLRLGQTLEANSIQERVRDGQQAWMLIRHLPLRGVGSGYYVPALWAWADATGRSFPAFQPVHNLPLLVTAEMGVGGLFFWLWLLLGPAVTLLRRSSRRQSPLMIFWAAAFVLLFVVNLLDYYLYIPLVWWPSLYLGLLLGGFGGDLDDAL